MTQNIERDDILLAEMLVLAEQLKGSDDALVVGQYEHLHARVAALIELRSLATATA